MVKTTNASFDNTIASLGRMYREKSLSPVEYTKHVIEEIECRRSLNAFVTVTPELALEAAARSEERFMRGEAIGALDGIPIALKDIIYTKGVRTTKGCDAYRDFVPDEDAFIVKQLKAAGYVGVGKANTCQFAMGPMGDVSFGGPCRNPHDETRYSGGSSSGSSSAVGAGIVPGAIGTDTGGSIRIPASLCGCVGLKPTFSLVSNEGIMPLSDCLDSAGPITRTVRDNAILLNGIAGYNRVDVYSACRPAEDYTRQIGGSVRGGMAVIDRRMFEEDVPQDVNRQLMEAVNALSAAGCGIREISFPDTTAFRKAHQMLLVAGGHREHRDDVLHHKDTIYPQVLSRLLTGDMSSDEYIGYMLQRNPFRSLLLDLMNGADVLALPSTPIAAVRIGEENVIVGGKSLPVITAYPRFTWIANIAGFPAISVPAGVTDEGMPVGFSLIARPFDEANLYRYAAVIEESFAG